MSASPGHFRFESGFGLGLACVVGLAVVILVLATHRGLATSSDSARYVRTARHLNSTEPEIDLGEPKREQAHYPPLYPIVLAIWGKLTRHDPLPAARWLHVLLFACNVLLTGMLVRRFGGSEWAALLAALVVAIAPVSIFIHSWLLSEPLFIFLSLVTIYLLMHHLEHPGWGWLIGAAVAASLGTLTRYAGAALAPAAVLALLLLPARRKPFRRAVDAAIFSLIFLCLPVLNLWQNLRIDASATNRVLAWHPISSGHIKDAIATLASWGAPLSVTAPRPAANAHPIVALAGAILFTLLLAAAIVVAWRRRGADVGRLAGLCVLYILCFGALLIFSISMVDFHTPADPRILSPMYIPWVIAAAGAISVMTTTLRPRVRAGAIAGCFLLACVIAAPSIRLVHRLHGQGDGFAHAMWRNSPTLAAVDQLPPNAEIFTNAPGAVYLLTGRELILAIPSRISASSLLPNPDYDRLMARIVDEMRAGRGVLVYLRRDGARRANYPTERELRKQLGLHRHSDFSDGAIYDLPPINARDAAPPPPSPHGDR